MEPILNTFVTVAPDSTATQATIPAARGEQVTVPVIQYELLSARPYQLTLEDLILATHVRRSGISAAEAKQRNQEIRAELFSKSHACMRASALPKTYGWGVHHNDAGRIKLVPLESAEYRRFAAGKVPGVKVVAAMRSKRAEK
jgi:hypothetical protein